MSFTDGGTPRRSRLYVDEKFGKLGIEPDFVSRQVAFAAGTQRKYALPGAMRAGFAQFTAFAQDVQDNKIFQQTKLTIPVLAVGGEKSFGAMEATVMRNVATNVREAVVHGAGHWLMEENPTETIALITNFLKA